MINTIDLCAGIGGIRRGFELAGGYNNVLSAEIDKEACKTYEHIFGDNPENDITKEKFKKLVAKTPYDVLLAGFPCQAFSSVGLQLGFRDTTRGTLFFDIADIISRTAPKGVFLENVENLVSHDSGKTLNRIVTILEAELDYKVVGVSKREDGTYLYSNNTLVRNSKDFGLPQNRPRVYIMAFSRKYFGDAISILQDCLPEKGEKIISEDLNDGILEESVEDIYYMASGYLETLKKHKIREKQKGNGFGYIVVNEPGKQHPIANTVLATGGSGKERNLVYQPKEGVAGKKLPSKKTGLNNEGIRFMTPKEWGRLQGFIDYAFIDEAGNDHFGFPDTISRAQQYKQFGNAVTIPVVEVMAKYMRECFEKMNQHQEGLIKDLLLRTNRCSLNEISESLSISETRLKDLIKDLNNKGIIKRVWKGSVRLAK